MSVLSLSLPPAVSEPVRRRAPEQEDNREAATFSLPEEAPQDRPAPAASTKERAEPRPADEPAPKRDDKAAEAAPAKATPDKTAADTAKTADKPKATAKPADAAATPATPAVPAAGGEQPKLDAGAIVAIAAASQVVAGKAQGATEVKSETKDKKDGEPAAAGEEKAVDPSAILPSLPVMVDAAPASGAALALAAGAAEGQGEATALAGIAMAAPGAAAVKSVGSAHTQPDDAAQAIASQSKAPAGLAAVASTEIVAKTEAGHDTDKPAAGGEAAAPPSAKDAALDKLGQAVAPGAFADAVKAAEAGPQAQAPIDLSAIVAPRGGKAEGLPGLDALAQATAQQAQQALPGHGAAGGSPTPLHVVPIEIGLRALAGTKSFDIRLDPAELGRIDVNLEISDKGEVSARLVVDRVETLHLLQRDARTLERAFEQAGLKPSDAGVAITLRDPSDQSGFRQSRQDQETSRQARGNSDAGEDTPVILAQPAPVRRLVRLGGVDLSI